MTIKRGADETMNDAQLMTWDEFEQICFEFTKKKQHINGICDKCYKFKDCLRDNKEVQIGSVLQMNANESRFPLALKLVQLLPFVLRLIPSSVYKNVYGLYHKHLACPFIPDEIINHIEEIKKAYCLLSNESSKNTFLRILLYRLTLDKTWLSKVVSDEPMYFIKPFRNLGPDEVFVDCGAYVGDTVNDYFKYNSAPKSVYAFEPDSVSRKKLEETIKKYTSNTAFHVFSQGLSDTFGQMFFEETGGQGSHFSENNNGPGHSSIELTTIDDAVSEIPTFIKMDIEGFEKCSIMGGKKYISVSHPKLAICIYHKTTDYWEIPLLIKEEFPEYKNFEVRQYSNGAFETVLFVHS